MALPPLAPIPNLQRLLTPDEVLLYTLKFHPLLGWPYMLAGLPFLGLSYFWPPFLLGTVVFFMIWQLPFWTNEVAVTDARLLMRTGRFHLLVEAIEDECIMHWKMEQGPLGNILRVGRVTLRVKDNMGYREIILNWVWHPMTFLEALEALQAEKFGHGEVASAAPGTQA